MKKILISAILTLTFSVSYSQIDTCQIDSNAYYFYMNDAANLTVDSIDSNPLHPYYDSIVIPQTMLNRILKCFSSLYTLNSPERDTIINIYDIHCQPPVPATFPLVRKSIVIGVDTNFNWVLQFIQDSVYSGNPAFDSLIAGLGFQMIQCSPFVNSLSVKTDNYYHLRPLIEALLNIPGVTYAMEPPFPGFCSESINKITYHSIPASDELIFSHAWDCFDCCNHRRFWKFKVFPNCSTAFAGSWTDNTPVVPVQNNVRGYVKYVNTSSTPIKNCNVLLIMGNDTLVQTTDSLGFFEFAAIQDGNYQLMVNCSIPWGGVNSTDALNVVRHFVGLQLLTPFRQIAAEVNYMPAINASDALTILKRFLGITNSFVTGDWLFESLNITVSGQSVTNISLKGICYGDVDGSYIPNQ